MKAVAVCFLLLWISQSLSRPVETLITDVEIDTLFGVISDQDGVHPPFAHIRLVNETQEFTGNYEPDSGQFSIVFEKSSVGADDPRIILPEGYILSNAFPNPPTDQSKIFIGVPGLTHMNVDVYNILGQLVNSYSKNLEPGNHMFAWDGTNSQGLQVGNGMYLINLTGESSGKPIARTYKIAVVNPLSGKGGGFFDALNNGNGYDNSHPMGARLVDFLTGLKLYVDAGGRFPYSGNVDITSQNLGPMEVILDRKAIFTSRWKVPEQSLKGGETAQLIIPQVNNDGDNYNILVVGNYTDTDGSTIDFKPPVDFTGDVLVEALLQEERNGSGVIYSCDSLKTLFHVMKGNIAPEILNRNYFTDHPAYLMAGQTNTDSSYALPLDGIEKLATGPLIYDANGDSLVKELNVSDPDMIGAFIDGNNVLRIFGKDASKTGMGYVELKISDPSGEYDSIRVPVVVFGRDRTLMVDGVKKYYVPWSPELDENRITSVEQFLVDNGYQEEDLDRTVNFSRWEIMKRMKDVSFSEAWANSQVFPNWTGQKTRIDWYLDYLFKYLNVDWIRIRSTYFMDNEHSNEIYQIFDGEITDGGTRGLSMSEEELKYIINQVHHKGGKILIKPFISDINFSRGGISPNDWNVWFDNYKNIVLHLAEISKDTGVDMLAVGESLLNLSGTISDESFGNYFNNIISKVRKIYSGPITYLDGLLIRNGAQDPNDWNKYTFLDDIDVLSSSAWFPGLITNINPTKEQIISSYGSFVDRLLVPLVESKKKPLIWFENFCPSMYGALYNFPLLWNNAYDSDLDLDEQVVWYSALSEATKNYDWLKSAGGFWGLSFHPLTSRGVNNKEATFFGKPAEDVIKFYYGNGDLSKKVIQVDGNTSDWNPSINYVKLQDPVDGQILENDFIGLYAVKDSLNLYLRAEFQGALRNQDLISFLIDLDDDNNPELAISSFYSNKWMSLLYDSMDSDQIRDVIFSEMSTDRNNIELSIPLTLLYSPNSIGIKIEVIDNNQKKITDTSDSFLLIP